MSGIDNRKDLLLLLLYMPGPSGELCAPITGRTRLMKLLFLMEHEIDLPRTLDIRNWYEFEPYTFGPFTHEVFEDIEFLQNVGLIGSSPKGPSSLVESEEAKRAIDLELEEFGELHADAEAQDPAVNEEVYVLSAKGKAFVEQRLLVSLDPSAKGAIATMKARAGTLALSSLLKYVYTRFPHFAVKSELNHLRP